MIKLSKRNVQHERPSRVSAGAIILLLSLVLLILVLPGTASVLAQQPNVAGNYAGAIIVGDQSDDAPMPKEFLQSFDLELTLVQTGGRWTGEVSLRQRLLQNRDTVPRAGTLEVLKGGLATLNMAENMIFDATSVPIEFKLQPARDADGRIIPSTGRTVKRTITLLGSISIEDCRVTIEGEYIETVENLIPGVTLSPQGTFSLLKMKGRTPAERAPDDECLRQLLSAKRKRSQDVKP